MRKMCIAIDGTSGSGKSSVAKILATEISGYKHLNTGSMYRAMAKYCLDQFIDVNSEIEVNQAIENIDLDIKYNKNAEQNTYVNGVCYDKFLRDEIVGNYSSKISKYKKVREKLVKTQRELADEFNLVLEGRDITSVVLPESQFKFFITATPEVRAKRRQLELIDKGENVSYKKIYDDLVARDYSDSHRVISPLIQTEDSFFIDNSDMSVAQEVNLIKSIIAKKLAQRSRILTKK